MKESKTFTCAVDQEQRWVDTYRSFGWDLKSSQEVNSKESHLEAGKGLNYDKVYSVTTSERYIKLVFERDDRMKGYSELVVLQKKYEDAASQIRPVYPFRFFLFIVLLVVPYLIIHILHNKKVKAKNDEMFAIMNDCQQKAIAVIRKYEDEAQN